MAKPHAVTTLQEVSSSKERHLVHFFLWDSITNARYHEVRYMGRLCDRVRIPGIMAKAAVRRLPQPGVLKIYRKPRRA